LAAVVHSFCKLRSCQLTTHSSGRATRAAKFRR
jgi:hypothetical protein